MPNYDQNVAWKILLGLSALPLFVLLLFYPSLPESPRWDIANGNTDRAFSTLQNAAAQNGSELPQGGLVEVEKRGANTDSFASLCGSSIRRVMVPLIPLWVCAAMNYYGIVLLTTELFAEENSGNRCGGTATTSSAESKSDGGCTVLTDRDYRDTLVDSFAEFPGMV